MRLRDSGQPKSAHGRFTQAWRRIYALPVLLPTALFLTACGTTGTTQMPVAKVIAPEQCLALADPLPLLTDATLGGAIRNHIESAERYWELAERHRCLVQFERAR